MNESCESRTWCWTGRKHVQDTLFATPPPSSLAPCLFSIWLSVLFLSPFVLLFASFLHLCSIPPCFRPLQGFINCLQRSICISSLLQSLSLSIYLLISFFLSFYPSLYLFQPPSLNLSRSLSFFSLNPFLSFSSVWLPLLASSLYQSVCFPNLRLSRFHFDFRWTFQLISLSWDSDSLRSDLGRLCNFQPSFVSFSLILLHVKWSRWRSPYSHFNTFESNSTNIGWKNLKMPSNRLRAIIQAALSVQIVTENHNSFQ